MVCSQRMWDPEGRVPCGAGTTWRRSSVSRELPRLSPAQRRLRLDSVTRALRKLHLPDDWDLMELFAVPQLPTREAIVRKLKQGPRDLPAGMPADYIAKFVLDFVRSGAASAWTLEGLEVVLPSFGVASAEELRTAVREMIQWYKYFVEEVG